MPTAQASPRALNARRKSAPMPYPASARTVPKRTPAAIRRSSSARAISDLVRAERYSAGPPALEPNFLAASGLRQEQPYADHHWDLAARQRQRHQGLAIRSLAQGRRILRRDPHRMRPLLRQSRVVNDEEGVRAADQLVRLERKLTLQRSLVPDAIRHEMVQSVVIARRDPLGHRADALAIARPNQPRHVERTQRQP